MPPTDQNSNENKGPMSEIVDRLKGANNVLITVSNNPSVDQLSACIGLTVALNKKDKHATAVFSGSVPSTIDFLEPDKTLEKDTNSLRDFIISLDKAKADKLRYKVEDEVVKIFITPYKTSITDADLDFSQGDFNVDAVVALGVHNRSELDAAIVAHGRILHDATIISVVTSGGSELGALNWVDSGASSLSEMTADLVQAIDDKVIDSQIATAFLTGIVAETDRFKNEKASPHTMSVAGILMSAGASPQLVSSKLEEPLAPEDSHEIPEVVEDLQSDHHDDPPKEDDGMIQIDHPKDEIHIDDSGKFAQVSEILKDIDEQAQKEKNEQEIIADHGAPLPETPPEEAEFPPTPPVNGPAMVYEPPTFGGQLTANTSQVDQQYISSPDPLTVPAGQNGPTLSHSQPGTPVTPTTSDLGDRKLSDLEKSVNSPHVAQYIETPVPPLPEGAVVSEVPPAEPGYARDAVERAVQASADYRPEPIQALGAQPVGLNLGHEPPKISELQNDVPGTTPPPPVPPPFSPPS